MTGISVETAAPAGVPSTAKSGVAPGPGQQEELNLLFLQQAKSGSLSMNGSRKGSLVLAGISKHTIWFTDRPGRSAGQVRKTQRLISCLSKTYFAH